MKYYRLAVQNRRTGQWIWKTTLLTSLPAVFHLLRIYAPLPLDEVRIFEASSKEELNEMLARENRQQASGSVTLAQFASKRNIHLPEATRAVAGVEHIQQGVVATCQPSLEVKASQEVMPGTEMNAFERRRLELENGPGGDHDSAYTFTLPTYMPRLLIWVKLMVRVRNGE